MRQKTCTLSKIQDIIMQLPDQFEQREVDIVTVMQNGKPVIEIIPHKTFEKLIERLDSLLEMLQDIELMESI